MAPKNNLTRRGFIRTIGAGVAGGAVFTTFGRAPAAQAASLVGPNDRIGVCVVGTGGMGTMHVRALAGNDQCDLIAVCDVGLSRAHNAANEAEKVSGNRPEVIQDFREVLARKDIDAIFCASPDHWHPLITILACQAGKDVYVEKPASCTIAEGRAMIDAARRYGRIVQLGTQQRSMPVFQKAMDIIHSGKIGQVTTATAWVGTNGLMQTFTHGEDVPNGLDWDLWLGPAPWVPFQPERYYAFRAWHDYARGGELTNWGVHLMDIVHWGIGEEEPLSVQAVGGSYQQGAGADNYEVVDAIFEYPGCTVTWEQRHTNLKNGKGYGIRFQGTEGRITMDRGSYIVEPEGLGIEEFVGEPETTWANTDHHNDFFNSIRTRRKPVADIAQGARSTNAPLMAGIALKTQRKLNWDKETWTFVDDPQANEHLTRAYRAPWRLPV